MSGLGWVFWPHSEGLGHAGGTKASSFRLWAISTPAERVVFLEHEPPPMSQLAVRTKAGLTGSGPNVMLNACVPCICLVPNGMCCQEAAEKAGAMQAKLSGCPEKPVVRSPDLHWCRSTRGTRERWHWNLMALDSLDQGRRRLPTFASGFEVPCGSLNQGVYMDVRSTLTSTCRTCQASGGCHKGCTPKRKWPEVEIWMNIYPPDNPRHG